jgi:hypothetical protein
MLRQRFGYFACRFEVLKISLMGYEKVDGKRNYCIVARWRGQKIIHPYLFYPYGSICATICFTILASHEIADVLRES